MRADDEEVSDLRRTSTQGSNEGTMGASRRRHKRGRARSGGAPKRPVRDCAGEPARPRLQELCELSPFSMFCALYLGITSDERYARANADEVRRRFELGDVEFKEFIESNGLTGEDLRCASFDLESARLDIKVAPPGVSRVELARTLYTDFCVARDANPSS